VDLSLCKTISFFILCVGSALVFAGTVGTWYFGNRLEAVRPYRQPIRTATATVEVAIVSSEDIRIKYANKGATIGFGKNKEPLLILRSDECTARQTGQNEVIYGAVLDMDTTSSAAGKPINFLKKTDYVQIKFFPMPEKNKVSTGKVICTLNSDVQVEIIIPPQDTTKGLIFVRDLENVFSEFKE